MAVFMFYISASVIVLFLGGCIGDLIAYWYL
jgi:hypothetical protein